MIVHDPFEDSSDGLPSKTRRKQDSHERQALGEALAALPVERIEGLDLPEALRDALLEIKTYRAHGAVRRQLQYIGRLMREVDPEPLRLRLEDWKGTSAASVARMHLAERWRDRLLADETSFSDFVRAYPQADAQQLRALIRGSQREHSQQRPPRNYRELYRMIGRVLDGTTGQEAGPSGEGELR